MEKYIAKSIKSAKSGGWLPAGLGNLSNTSGKDMLVFVIVLLLFLPIYLPLLLNFINSPVKTIDGNIIGGICTIFIAFFISGILQLKFKQMKLYVFFYRSLIYIFTKNKIKMNFIESVEGNKIILKDVLKTEHCYYRILGKDISLLDDEDFLQISDGLGEFFKEDIELKIYKIDNIIDLNSPKNYLKSLNGNNEIQIAINHNLNLINELESTLKTSTQSKYFIKINNSDNLESILEELQTKLIFAKIELRAAEPLEMDDILTKIYFQNKIVDEHWNCLVLSESELKELEEENVDEKFEIFSESKTKKISHNIKFNKNNKELNNKMKDDLLYVSFIGITGFPKIVNDGWLEFLFNTIDMDISTDIQFYDASKLEKNIDSILQELEVKLENPSTKHKVNIMNEEEYNSFLELSEDIYAGEVIKENTFLLKITAKSKEELKLKFKKIYKDLIRKKFSLDPLYFEQFFALRQFFPNINNELKKRLSIEVMSNTLGFGYPFTQQELIDPKGLPLGLDANNTPILLDFKKIDYYKNSSSMLLLGKTGAGKTTTAKRILENQILSNEYKIFAIDPENEYGEFIESYGGIKITINNGKDIINPFDLGVSKNNWEFKSDEYNNLIRDKTLFLSTWFKIIFDTTLTQNDINTLTQFIVDMYNTKNYYKVEFTFSTIYKNMYILNKKTHEFDRILKAISIYCKTADGMNGFAFDGVTNIDLNNNYISFQFRDLISKSGITSLGKAHMFLVLQFLNQLVLNNRDIDNPKYINILLDEAHLIIDEKYLEIVSFVNEMFKRIRKYNGMMMLLTQNIGDFYKPSISGYTIAMINNAFFYLLHTVKPNEITALDEMMKEQGGLSTEEKAFLKSDIRGRCLLLFNNTRTMCEIIKSEKK